MLLVSLLGDTLSKLKVLFLFSDFMHDAFVYLKIKFDNPARVWAKGEKQASKTGKQASKHPSHDIILP